MISPAQTPQLLWGHVQDARHRLTARWSECLSYCAHLLHSSVLNRRGAFTIWAAVHPAAFETLACSCIPLPFVVRCKCGEQVDCLIRESPYMHPRVHAYARREEDGALVVESDKDGAYVTLESALASILALPSQVRDECTACYASQPEAGEAAGVQGYIYSHERDVFRMYSHERGRCAHLQPFPAAHSFP